MILVVIESPYEGDLNSNVNYARACMRDCLMKGEAPYAEHLLYTQPGILNDENFEEKTLGVLSGFEWAKKADKTVVYIDLGISDKMRDGIQSAKDLNRPIEIRYFFRDNPSRTIFLEEARSLINDPGAIVVECVINDILRNNNQ